MKIIEVKTSTYGTPRAWCAWALIISLYMAFQLIPAIYKRYQENELIREAGASQVHVSDTVTMRPSPERMSVGQAIQYVTGRFGYVFMSAAVKYWDTDSVSFDPDRGHTVYSALDEITRQSAYCYDICNRCVYIFYKGVGTRVAGQVISKAKGQPLDGIDVSVINYPQCVRKTANGGFFEVWISPGNADTIRVDNAGTVKFVFPKDNDWLEIAI